ncbi:MAG: DUF1385 domain-containing protein [Oscillospiraceae bacterium]|nr:DUF1385 domain-containing protein [Candidatus Equicaccousia limihippi]
MKKVTSIGGQALIEGIMMRGPKKTVIAVKKRDGEILTEEMHFSSLRNKNKFFNTPILRGAISFIEMLRDGYKALMFSADKSGFTEIEEAQEEEEQEKKLRKKAEKTAAKKGISQEAAYDMLKGKQTDSKVSDTLVNIAMAIGTVLGVALAVVLFMWLPTTIYNLIASPFGGPQALAGLKPIIEGVLKIAIFVGYLAIVSQMKDIRRVFMFHGAEHKSIFCYENGLELTVENVKKQSRFHPRCGTSFMFLMLFVGIVLGFVIQLIFPAVITLKWIWVVIKILLLPIVCGLGYELIKICGKYNNIVTRIIAAPGLWVQRLTTKEPDDDMCAVAIAALTQVIPDDGSDLIDCKCASK